MRDEKPQAPSTPSSNVLTKCSAATSRKPETTKGAPRRASSARLQKELPCTKQRPTRTPPTAPPRRPIAHQPSAAGSAAPASPQRITTTYCAGRRPRESAARPVSPNTRAGTSCTGWATGQHWQPCWDEIISVLLKKFNEPKLEGAADHKDV